MRLQKITLAMTAVAAASALACTGTHEVAAKSATPELQPAPVTVSTPSAPSAKSRAAMPIPAADTDTVRPAALAVGQHPTPPVLDSLIKGTLPARGLYVFRFAANTRRLKHLIAIADSTEINALIIDVKDEFGLNFDPADPMLKKNAGTQVKAHNLRALVDTIRAHGILPVARIVVFKDSVTARNNPDHTIRKADGSPWHDKKGQTWVNMGFGEIQFDYIRFPEPFKSLPKQVFPEQAGRSKPEVLAEFLKAARERFAKLGVRTTADVFGLVTTVGGALEVGQKWEPISESVDVVLPMVYPSHYPPGSFQLPHPNADPYDVIHIAISRARERDKPPYAAHEIEEQKRAVYDSGFDGWVMWEPGSRYDKFLPALEKTFVSRKKVPPVPRPANRLD
ncbi:MAG: hypothetical protein DMD72_00780 [Gemmatimonadetes bacterium]|nr:MAG: hypothetical protein DMD72_00780 [Gemmatimonadota bacterium]